MNTNRTCNNSFWTKEKDKIFENTLATDEDNNNLLEEMAKALSGKSADDVKDHYNILIEDINVIESGYVSLPNYPKMHNQNSEAHVEWRKGASWTEEEHSTILEDDINNLN